MRVGDERDPQTYAIIGAAMEEAQVLHYLRATCFRRGLLINFGARSLQYKRLVWDYDPETVESS